MDLIRHLRSFIVVAEELHFGRAAALLGTAQPPLSRTIRALERELGTDLFDRSRRQVRLTAAGELLVPEARELLSRADRLRAVLRRARDGDHGTLRAAVPPGTGGPVLKALLAVTGTPGGDAGALRAADEPVLRVEVQERTTAEQVRLLADGELDVGLVHHPVDPTGLLFGPAVAAELGVVLPRASPSGRRPEVALGELAGQGLVTAPRAAAPGWYDTVLDRCRAGGFVPDGIRHAENREFLLGLVAAGLGVAFDTRSAVRREPRVVWRPLTGRPLLRNTSAAWPAAGGHPAARRFAGIAARALARDAAADGPSSGPVAASGVEQGAALTETAPAGVEDTAAARPWSVVYAPPSHGPCHT